MIRQRDVVKKVAETHGGHIITGAQSIFEAPDPHIARFDLNENLFGPSPKVVDAIRNFVEKVGVNWYNAWLRNPCQEAIAKYACVRPSNVFVCNGSAELLVLLGQVFLDPGDELIAAYPTYRPLINYARMYESKVVEVLHEKDFNADRLPQKMSEKIGPKTKMVYLCNPTTFAAKVPKAEIVKLLDRAQESKSIVIVDEAYYDSGTYPLSNVTVTDLIDKYDNLIVVRTFSKSFAMAGLRIGYAISCEENTTAFDGFFSPLGISSLAYVAAMAALEDLPYYEDVRKKIELNKQFLSEELVKLKVEVFPSCTNCILARFPPGILNDSAQRKGLWTRLVERGIYLRNKSVMYSQTDLCHDMVRITIGKREDCERFVDELRTML